MNSDLTKVLHLTDTRGRSMLAFYGFATGLVAVLNLGNMNVPWLAILTLALLWVALTVLGWRGTSPLGIRPTVAVITLVAVIATLSAWNIADVEHPGYSTWYLGASTILLLVLGLRGRRRWAWGGFLVLAAIALGSTFQTGQDGSAAVNELLRQAGTLLIGTLFATAYRRAGVVIAGIQGRQVQRAASEAATAAATLERAAQGARLERHARPALERLLDDTPLDESERLRMALLEAELRDAIRATGFTSPPIVAATRASRARGTHVVLVDDRGLELDPHELARVESALIPELETASDGTITARLSPLDSDEIATIVVADGDEYRRTVVTADAVEVTTLSPDFEDEELVD